MKFVALFDNKGLILLAMILIAGYIAFKASQPVPAQPGAQPNRHAGRYR